MWWVLFLVLWYTWQFHQKSKVHWAGVWAVTYENSCPGCSWDRVDFCSRHGIVGLRGYFIPPHIMLRGEARLASFAAGWSEVLLRVSVGWVKTFLFSYNLSSPLLCLFFYLIVVSGKLFLSQPHYLLYFQFFSPSCGRGREGAGGSEQEVLGCFSENTKLENTIPKSQLWNLTSAEVIAD